MTFDKHQLRASVEDSVRCAWMQAFQEEPQLRAKLTQDEKDELDLLVMKGFSDGVNYVLTIINEAADERRNQGQAGP